MIMDNISGGGLKMTNNELLVRSSLQNTQPKVETTKQEIAVTQRNEVVSKPAIEKEELSGSNLAEQKSEDKKEVLHEKVAQLNEHMQHLNRSLQFSVDETSGDTVVKVIDAETKEVVRQIPSQDVIDARNAVSEYRGLLLETKV
jgi:flagellar protein FlaG